MRFTLVEEILQADIDKIKSNKHFAKSQKLSKKNKEQGAENRDKKYDARLMKSVEQNKKALDGISANVSAVKDDIASVMVNGIDSPSFQFICKLPNVAYTDRDKFGYFVKKLLKGELGVEVPRPQTTESLVLTEANASGLVVDPDFGYEEGKGDNPKNKDGKLKSLYLNPSLWRASSNEFKNILDLYSRLNNQSNAQKVFGNQFETVSNSQEGLTTYFVEEGSGNVKPFTQIKSDFDKISDNERSTQARAEREAKMMSVDEIAKKKEIPAYNMLLGLVKDYHGQLSSSKYASGKKSGKYYTRALRKLGDDLKAKANGEQLDEIGTRNANFLEKFLTTKRYTKVSPFKILSDFENAVDEAVSQEIIGIPVPQRQRPQQQTQAAEG